jgi:hypothetical protein
MPKSASTVARQTAIEEDIASSRQKPIAFIEYYDETAARWIPFDDVMSFSFSRTAKENDVAKFSLVPQPQTFSLEVDNTGGKYTPGTSGKFADKIIRNMKLRAQIGYALTDTIEREYDYDEEDYQNLFHTQVIGSKIYNNVTAGTYLALPGITFRTYDSGDYDDIDLEGEGYFLSDIWDLLPFNVETMSKIAITSDTDKIKVYYRVSNNYTDLSGNTAPFIYAGDTVNGITEIPILATTERYFQFVLVYATSKWYDGTDENYSTDIKIITDDTSEIFSLGEFLLDSASFGSQYSGKSLSISARDTYKKALETKISTADYAITDISQIIRDICDRAGILYNDGVTNWIPDSTYTVSIEGYKNVTATAALAESVEYLSYKDSNYRLYITDAGYMRLDNTAKSTTNVDFVLNYLDHMYSFERSFDSDNEIQRISYVSKKDTRKQAASADDPDSGKEVILVSGTYTTAGANNVIWTGGAAGLPFINKRYKIVINSGTFTFNSWETGAINFTLGGTSPSVVLTVYGDEVSSTYDGFTGEASDGDNVAESLGYTTEKVNRFIQSDADAKAMSEAILSRFNFDDEEYRGTVSMTGHPLIEINDTLLLLEKNTNTYYIFIVEKISTSYNAENASYKTSLSVRSIGATLESIVYDRNFAMHGIVDGIDDFEYDSGIFYDLDFWSEDTDPEVYVKPIQFT